VESAARASDLMYGFGGTTSIQDACTPSQCFRDVHVVARSVTVPYEAYRTWSFAKAAFGVPGKRPCWV
jgi:hypothetical protein